MNFFYNLTNDVSLYLISFFEIDDLIRFSQLNKYTKLICDEKIIWKAKYYRFFIDDIIKDEQNHKEKTIERFRCIWLLKKMFESPNTMPGLIMAKTIPTRCRQRNFDITIKKIEQSINKTIAELGRIYSPFDTTRDDFQRYYSWNILFYDILNNIGYNPIDIKLFSINKDKLQKDKHIEKIVHFYLYYFKTRDEDNISQTVEEILLKELFLLITLKYKIPLIIHKTWDIFNLATNGLVEITKIEMNEEMKKKRKRNKEEVEKIETLLDNEFNCFKKPKITNIVTQSSLGVKLDLKYINSYIFLACQKKGKTRLHITMPNADLGIHELYSSGKIITSGINNIENIEKSWNILLKELRKIDVID